MKMRRYNHLVTQSIILIHLALLSTDDAFFVHGLQVMQSWTSSVAHVIEHLASPPLRVTPLEEIANTKIPGPAPGIDILAYVATPSSIADKETKKKNDDNCIQVVIMIHEFFGLNPSIVEKAKGLADDLGCIVIAPDTFRGTVTDFIPKAIWLALSTPQDRVNDDLDSICNYIQDGRLLQAVPGEVIGNNNFKLAVMGFCYGGGKAIRYCIQRRPDAAPVVFYGNPVTDATELQKLKAPLCGVFGRNDVQFPMKLLDDFKEALNVAGVQNDVQVYDGVGHAFWTDMGQVKRGDEPQYSAYKQCTDFLRSFFEQER